MTAMADRTKMFHVKHFGTIGAKNLTSLKTRAVPRSGTINRFLVQLVSGGAAALVAERPCPNRLQA
jgi:hypothetical protein